MRKRKTAACASALLIANAVAIYAQTNSGPEIVGIVNAAAYSSPVSPGSIVSIFGSNLAVSTQSADATPLPTRLAGTAVTFDGVAAPLLFISPAQINAQVPSSIATSMSRLSQSTVVVSTGAGSSPASQVQVFPVGPGLFTKDSSGCGAAAALNVAPDGSTSINSTSNSAAPGDYITIFGTGLGIPATLPEDGMAMGAPDSFTSLGALHIDRSSDSITPSYSGLAPTWVGTSQVNFRIPTGTREGCAVPVSMDADILLWSTPMVTISIAKNRGQCTDPDMQSYGEVSIERSVTSGMSSNGEFDEFTARFPAGPGLQAPPLPEMTPGTNAYHFWTPAPSTRVCPVPGYSELSAGTITIQAPGHAAASAQPNATPSGVSYQAALPAGFVAPGPYTVTSEPGAGVSFRETFTVGADISIQTSLVPGTTLDASKEMILTWTGGDANSVVRVTLIADANSVASPRDVWYQSAGAGSLTLQSVCEGTPRVCSYGLPTPSKTAKLVVDVLPATGVAESVTVSGIAQPVRFTWAYHHVFGDLNITN